MKDKEITKLGLDRFKVIIGWRGKEDIASHVLAGISGGLGGQSMKSDTEISILKAVFYFLPYHICFTIDPYWKIEKKFHPVSAHIEMYKDYEIKGDPKKIIPYILYHLEEKILHKDYLPIQKTIKKIAETGLNTFINFIEEERSKDDTSKLFDKEYYSAKNRIKLFKSYNLHKKGKVDYKYFSNLMQSKDKLPRLEEDFNSFLKNRLRTKHMRQTLIKKWNIPIRAWKADANFDFINKGTGGGFWKAITSYSDEI